MRTALIGLGRMGLRHFEVLNALGLDVVAAADCFPEALARAEAAGLASDRLRSDAAKMLREAKAEVVVVATTAPSHCELVCAAAENGAQAILCEKPMATSISDCDRMIAACEANGTKLAINHQMRFMEQYTLPKELIGTAEFGPLGSITVVAGNFGVAMNGSHYFEMFRFMTDDLPTRVSAWFSDELVPNPRGPEFVDRAGCVRLETAAGQRFYMDASSDQGHGMFVCFASRNGRIEIDELAGRMHMVRRRVEHREQPTTRYGMPWDASERAIAPADAITPTKALMHSLLRGHGYPDGKVGRAVVQILVAAHVSHEEGGMTIDLSTAELPIDRVFPWA